MEKGDPWPSNAGFDDVVNGGILAFERQNLQLPSRIVIGHEAHCQMRMDQRIFKIDSDCSQYEMLTVEINRDAGIELH